MQYDTVVPPDRLSAPSGTHLYFRLFQLNPTTVSQSLTRSSNPPSTSPEPSHYILTFAFTQTLNSDTQNRMSYARLQVNGQNLPALVKFILALAWAQFACGRFVVAV